MWLMVKQLGGQGPPTLSCHLIKFDSLKFDHVVKRSHELVDGVEVDIRFFICHVTTWLKDLVRWSVRGANT